MFHVLSAAQFDKVLLTEILGVARDMEQILQDPKPSTLAAGKILAALFLEPSTRTRLSFETAMHRLGGKVITIADGKTCSASKGETIADTARIIGGFADIIAMRTKTVGSAKEAATTAGIPVLNGGDGPGEHPTQSLIDLFTISKYFDLEKEFTVTFVGDLKYGRTVHSLCTVLRNYPNVTMNFVAPLALQMPKKYLREGDVFTEDLSEVLAESDVVYDTRIQQERFDSAAEYEKFKGVYVFDLSTVSQMKDSAILMHPLPRIDEITPEVDELPQAKYFEQARNGVPVRMALIAKALGVLG